MDYFFIYFYLKSGQFWYSTHLLLSEEQGRFAERDEDVVAGDKTKGILFRYFKFLLNHLKYKGNQQTSM